MYIYNYIILNQFYKIYGKRFILEKIWFVLNRLSSKKIEIDYILIYMSL